MEEILDEEFKPILNPIDVVKIIAVVALIKLLLDLINYYLISPLFFKKIFNSTLDDYEGLGIILILVGICIFFVRKINQVRNEKDERLIALWGAICVFIGEMLFRLIAFYLIDQTATMKEMGFMIKDSFLLSIQGGFISYFIIKKIRNQDTLIPLILVIGIFYLFDFLFSINWL